MMTLNQIFSELMGKCWHELELIPDSPELYKCKKCDFTAGYGTWAYSHGTNPTYADSKGRMKDWTIPDFMAKELPEVWEGFLRYCLRLLFTINRLKVTADCASMLKDILSLSNLAEFLWLHADDWAWVECPSNRVVDCEYRHQYLVGYCPQNCNSEMQIPCNKTGKILNPRFGRALEGLREYFKKEVDKNGSR